MNSLTPQPINRILHAQQIEQVLRTLLINKPVELLRFIPRSGYKARSCPWIYYINEITGDRMASFVSFQDLFLAFWTWLETAQVWLLALWQRIAISKVIWQYVDVGDTVYAQAYGWVEVVEKDFSGKGIPRFWVAVGDRLEILMPCHVEVF